MGTKNEQKVPINEAIKLKEFLVIDETGKNLGSLKKDEALALAAKKNLDLVLISYKNDVGIAKILNYSKFKYEQKRKEKDNRKAQATNKSKEVKVKPLINDHDLQVKANNVIRWLDEGYRVVFIILSMGRMSTKLEYVDLVHEKFLKMIEGHGKVLQDKKRINDYKHETVIIPNKKK